MIGVFYIHGFNSGYKQAKIDAVDHILNQDDKLFDVHGLQWDSSADFTKNADQMLEQLQTAEQQYDDIVLIGCSLGGFYARYLANQLQCYCVLINPVVDPVEQLSKLVGIHTNYVTNKKYVFTDFVLQTYAFGMININDCHCLTYVSTIDKVLPTNLAFVNHYKNLFGKIIETTTDHMVSDYSVLPNFANEVRTLVNTIAG